jgi:hypothetical protein
LLPVFLLLLLLLLLRLLRRCFCCHAASRSNDIRHHFSAQRSNPAHL